MATPTTPTSLLPRPCWQAAADALKAAGDIVKLSTGLATGALVFSVGLLPNAPLYTPLVRGCLVASWSLLFLSIVAGVFSQAAIPVLMADQDYDIENRFFTYTGRIHQIFFGLGLFALALALSVVLYAEPARLRVSTALEATKIAAQQIGTQYLIEQLTKIELVKSPSNRLSEATWHAQFDVIPKPGTARGAVTTPSPSHLDVLVGAQSGYVMLLQN